MASSSSFSDYGGDTHEHEQQRINRIKEGISKMHKGELPTTEQTVHSLEHLKTSSTHHDIEQVVSPTGKRLVDDVDKIIDVAQKMLKEKNEGDHFQQMILHAKRAADLADRETLKSMKGQGTQIKSNLSMTYGGLIDIVKMLVSSGEFRSAITGLISVLMDIFKYNMGGNVPNKSSLSNAKEEMDNIASGEKSGRAAGHDMVDMVADATENMAPDNHERNQAPHMKDLVKETKERAYHMEIPQEHKEELITRLKESLKKFQNRPDFQKALDNLFSGMTTLLEVSKGYTREQKEKGKYALENSDADKEWKTAFDHARVLIENIFNGKSIMAVLKAIRTFQSDIKNDNYLLAWFQGWKNFIHAMLKDNDFIESDAFRHDAKELSEQTERLVADRYKDHANDVFVKVKDFISGAYEDSTNKEFMDLLRQLWSDACLDDDGNLTIKRELLKDIPRILQVLSDKIAYVPLPRVEHDSPEAYFMMDNVVLKCTGLIPTHLDIDINVKTDLSVPEIVSYLTMRLSHIQVSAENLDFSIKKKTGFFKVKESGRMDFSIYGKGLFGEIMFVPHVHKTSGGIEKGLNLERCNVDIDQLKINIHDTERHKLRYKLFKGLIQKIAKREISKMITENLRKILDPKSDNNDANNNNNNNTGETRIKVPSGTATTYESDYTDGNNYKTLHTMRNESSSSSTQHESGNGIGGMSRGSGMTSKWRDGLKMFRHGGDDSHVVKG